VASGILKTAAAIVLSRFGLRAGDRPDDRSVLDFRPLDAQARGPMVPGLQFVSAALYSLGHGGNDAQKTMGIIWMLLIASSLISAEEPLPFWLCSPARRRWVGSSSAAGASSRPWACESPS